MSKESDRSLVTWESIYQLESSLNEPIGAKERFILLSKNAKRLYARPNSLRILDGGGSNFTTILLKRIFPESFVLNVNIDRDIAPAD